MHDTVVSQRELMISLEEKRITQSANSFKKKLNFMQPKYHIPLSTNHILTIGAVLFHKENKLSKERDEAKYPQKLPEREET